MDRYQVSKQLGDGTYGSVLLAVTNPGGEKVAIKRMKKKYYRWDDCLSLREVKSLRKLKHANIVQLKEVIRENDQLYFVFEFMKENLYQMMKGRDKLFPESTVRNIIYQVLQGLAYMHKHGFFHRDLKPENLLCSGAELVKIADFGLAREIRSQPPYTDYVSTRWYRAPEVLLRSTNYNSPIDLWALGSIMAELYTLRPLFPGSSEIDEIFKICSILGTPTRADWNEGHQLAAAMNFKWPQCVATNLKSLMPNASNDGIQYMKDAMAWDPKKRPTAAQSLKYPFFQVGQGLFPSQVQPQRPQQPAQSMTQRQPLQQKAQPVFASPVEKSPVMQKEMQAQQQQQQHQQQQQRQMNQENKNPLLPSIQSKQTGANKQQQQQQNKDSFSYPGVAKKSGRKRWGASESWDDWDDFDINQSMNKTKRNVVAAKKRDDEDIFSGFNKPKRHSISKKDEDDIRGFHKPKRASIPKIHDDDDDFFGFGSDKKSPTKNMPGHANSGQSSENSSAKQHYMNKARYLPGINARNSGKKDNSPNNWGSGMGKQTGIGGMSYGRTNNPGGTNYGQSSNTGYVPSFLSNTTTNKTNYGQSTWKRAQPAPISLNKNSANLSKPIGASTQVAGRTDWAAKYLKS